MTRITNVRRVTVWDSERGEAVGEPLFGHSDDVKCDALSADGSRIVTGSWDRTVRVWDAESGEVVGEPLRGHTGVARVAVSADGSLIVWEDATHLKRLWDARIGECVLTARETLWHSTVNALALSWSSSSGGRFGDWVQQVIANDDNGNHLALASCEEVVRNLDGGDR